MKDEKFNTLTYDEGFYNFYIENQDAIEKYIFKIEDFVAVSIDADKMSANLMILYHDENIKIDMPIIKNVLKVNNIIFGVDYNKIEELLQNNIYNEPIKIAFGKPKVDGCDGYFIYHFDKEPSLKPQLLEDGSVDFRNLNIVQNVKENQLLVTYIPPTQGIDGCYVTGEIISAKKGKSLKFPKGKKVKVSEDGYHLLAEIDGNVEIVNGKVCVSNKMIIDGNVDASTGDISFNGDVFITGNILTGFTIIATGSINVDGFVEASLLKADGDIILKNGIQGSGKGKLISGGNVVTKFIEMCEVYAKGNITTNAIMNSFVESEQNIIVSGKRGFIIGGITKALDKIQAIGLGNTSEIITTLEVGFTDENAKQLLILEKEIKTLVKEIKLIERNNKGKINSIELMREKIEKTAQYNIKKKEHERLKKLKIKETFPSIEIKKTIHRGVVLFMKSDIYKVNDSMESISFRIGNQNKIILTPYNVS